MYVCIMEVINKQPAFLLIFNTKTFVKQLSMICCIVSGRESYKYLCPTTIFFHSLTILFNHFVCSKFFYLCVSVFLLLLKCGFKCLLHQLYFTFVILSVCLSVCLFVCRICHSCQFLSFFFWCAVLFVFSNHFYLLNQQCFDPQEKKGYCYNITILKDNKVWLQLCYNGIILFRS